MVGKGGTPPPHTPPLLGITHSALVTHAASGPPPPHLFPALGTGSADGSAHRGRGGGGEGYIYVAHGSTVSLIVPATLVSSP